MDYVGIDAASKESAVCILDDQGKIVREAKLTTTDPEAIGCFLTDTGLAVERVGLESGCTAAWLFAGAVSKEIGLRLARHVRNLQRCAIRSATSTAHPR